MPLLRTFTAIAIGASILSLTSGAAPAWAQSPAADEKKVAFEIAAGPLARALSQFAETGSVQFLYSSELSDGLRTPGLRGTFTLHDGITQLLAGSGLTFRFIDARTISIDKLRTSDARVLAPVRVEGSSRGARRSAGTTRGARTRAGQNEEGAVEPQAFADGNMDIPRTIDDAQPYYVFDANTIDASGAVNVEDFLKHRLTMNAVAQTNNQTNGSNLGATSAINLRGLGADKTLVLVNGRRMAGVSINALGAFEQQPDINAIPLSAIERVEVLPSSASGIYGGSAIGGVVNVVLKRDYVGGEVQATYGNTWDTDAASRSLSASYGMQLEDGKTHVSFAAAWSDAKPLLLQDRVSIYDENAATISRNHPTYFSSNSSPQLGSLPNIVPNGANTTTLTLDDGRVLSSRNTHIPATTSPATSPAELAAGLLANAGKINVESPPTAQQSTGLLRPFGATPETKSITTSVRRQMLPRLELFADLSYSENQSESIFNPLNSWLTVPVNAPTNPFTTAVRVVAPDATQVPITSRSQNRSATIGALMQLPWGWSGAGDYTWSESRFETQSYSLDNAARDADLLSGALNPFVDTLRYPLDLQRYLVPNAYQGKNRLHGLALRASGPLPSLPWGAPGLTFGLERRVTQTPERTLLIDLPITVSDSSLRTYFKRKSTTDSGYLEATIPLVKSDWLPGMRALEMQLAGRGDRYTVDTGTSMQTVNFNRTPPTTTYAGPMLDGQPFVSEATYTSTNFTIGLKYSPVEELTMRASRATAFLPPSPTQLTENPLIDMSNGAPSLTTITDPRTGARYGVQTLSGGNADVAPQSSKSLNAGIIWQPRWEPLHGLRLNAEYYRIEQFNTIGALGVQRIVDSESIYPGRVQRDGNGTITLVNNTAMNLYRRDTEGWDFSADYVRETKMGRFSLYAVESVILGLKNQYAQNLPENDALNFPAEGGAAKYKTNASLRWDWQGWAASWTARYFSSYKQSGALGGPSATQRLAQDPNGGLDTTYTLAQGGDTIRSQIYHDLNVGYSFDDSGSLRRWSLLSGLTLQLGIRNVFNKVPPFDVFYRDNYYLSPYGDVRLRSYWLNAKAAF